jgi:hypothetical protein
LIKLQCVCGHTLNLPEKLEGQKIRCKRCEKVMRVPSAGAATAASAGAPHGPGPSDSDPSLQIAGSRPCPGCGKLYPPSVRVCVACGVNVESGAQLYVSMEEVPLPPGLRPAALLDEAPAPPASWWRRLLARLGLG